MVAPRDDWQAKLSVQFLAVLVLLLGSGISVSAQPSPPPAAADQAGDTKVPPATPVADPWKTPAGGELIAANNQHFYIALPISRCFPEVDIIAEPADSAISVGLLLYLQPDGQHRMAPGSRAPADFKPNSLQNSVLYLSDAIGQARSRAAGAAELNKDLMGGFQLGLVVISALATILVGIKSVVRQDTPWMLAVGIGALICSALSTAGTSLYAFYAPNDVYTRNQTALVQLRQLHAELAAYAVDGGTEICKEPSGDPKIDDRNKAVKEFRDRFIQIVSAANAVGTKQTGPGGPGTGGGHATPPVPTTGR
jgi:hypothetical protein